MSTLPNGSVSNASTTQHQWLKGGQRPMQHISLSNESLLSETRKWIEECTGVNDADKSYTEYLMDGTVLCKLIQCLYPGMIKRVNKHKNPFAWRENLTFFLEACGRLGLKNSQLFSLEDLLPSSTSTSPHRAKTVQDSEKSLKKVALTVYWLHHTFNRGELHDIEVKSNPDPSLSEESQRSATPTIHSSPTTPASFSSPPLSPRVQQFTSIISETPNSNIHFFPEIIKFQDTVSSPHREHSSTASHSNLVEDPLRSELHTDTSSPTDTQCNGTVLDTERVDWTPSNIINSVKNICSVKESYQHQHVSETVDVPLHPESVHLDDHCMSELDETHSHSDSDQDHPTASTSPSEVIVNSEQIVESISVPEYPVTVVVPSVTSQPVAEIPERTSNTHQDTALSVAESVVDSSVESSSDTEYSGHSHQLPSPSLAESHNQKADTMEGCLSIPGESGLGSSGLKSEEVIAVDKLNMYTTSAHTVPHHSLTVSLSDAESPPSHKVNSNTCTSVEMVRDTMTHTSFEKDSDSVDPKPNEGHGVEVMEGAAAQPDPRSQNNSRSLQIQGSSKSSVTRKSSFLSSVMQVADKHAVVSTTARPTSAPTRSSPNMTTGTSATLPSQPNSRLVRDKQQSEYSRRRANIEEGARAAFQYSAKRQSLKALSLPRGHKSPSLSTGHSISTKSNEEKLDRKSSSPAVMDNISTPVQLQDESACSGDPNLTNTSFGVDSGFQLEEIWNEIEQIGRGKSKDVPMSGGSLTVAESTTKELTLPNGRSNGRDDAIEEKDIVVAFEESQSRSVTNASLQYDSPDAPQVNRSTLPRSNEEKAKHRTSSFSNKQIESLLLTLRSLSARDDEVKELNILEGMLKSNTFKRAKQVHDNMHHLLSSDRDVPRPVVKRAVPTAQLMRQHLHHHTEPSREVDELRSLLRAPHVQAVLLCHDKVSTRDLYLPTTRFHRAAQDPVDIVVSDSVYNFQAPDQPLDSTIPLSRDVPSCRKEDATIVFLERSNRPLGCTFYKQEDSVFFGKLLKGCDAEASDLLREGDELLEVNGVPVSGKSTDEIVTLMSGDAQPGTVLALTIIPVHDDNIDLEYEPKYIKAHFNYNANLDEEIPCKALGLTFQKGDILEISSYDNPEWWQARKVFDDGAESLPGLIPSRHLQQQRKALVGSYPFGSAAIERKKGVRSMFSRRRKKKIFYQSTSQSATFGVGDEVPTYEDVVKLEPSPDLIRPLVLIGAPGVGRRTLIRKLLNSNASHYSPVVQHTTRPMRPGEENGRDYLFVTREEFECDIEQDRFLEYGELKGYYYGTAFSSIKRIMESRRVPVLELQPQALKKVRHCGLKPYIVFVASPRLERLHVTRKAASDKVKKRLGSTLQHHDSTSRHVHTETDLQHLVQESFMIENQYGHYFDWIIINDDFQVAADMLKEVAQRAHDEPQWVPKLWYLNHY